MFKKVYNKHGKEIGRERVSAVIDRPTAIDATAFIRDFPERKALYESQDGDVIYARETLCRLGSFYSDDPVYSDLLDILVSGNIITQAQRDAL